MKILAIRRSRSASAATLGDLGNDHFGSAAHTQFHEGLVALSTASLTDSPIFESKSSRFVMPYCLAISAGAMYDTHVRSLSSCQMRARTGRSIPIFGSSRISKMPALGFPKMSTSVVAIRVHSGRAGRVIDMCKGESCPALLPPSLTVAPSPHEENCFQP